MKMNMKFLALAILVVATSCSAPKTISSLSVETSFDREPVTLTTGDAIELIVKAVDGDGIQSVSIDIPALGTYDLYDDISDGKWNHTRTLQIDSASVRGVSEITVIMRDKNGEEKTVLNELVID